MRIGCGDQGEPEVARFLCLGSWSNVDGEEELKGPHWHVRHSIHCSHRTLNGHARYESDEVLVLQNLHNDDFALTQAHPKWVYSHCGPASPMGHAIVQGLDPSLMLQRSKRRAEMPRTK